MDEGVWILAVEPNQGDRHLIEVATRMVAPWADLVFVDDVERLVPEIASRGFVPVVAIIDWFAGDAASCVDTLSRLGFFSRMAIVATSRHDALKALDDSYRAGVGRFICKLPDDTSFRKKVAEAISEFIPGAKKLTAPAEVLRT